MSVTPTIEPRGPFSLQAAAELGFGPNEGRPPPFDGAMRLAFAVDGGRGHAGAVLRQPTVNGPVEVELEPRGRADPEAALAQIARTVSLDHDGEEFLEVGRRDPVIGALHRLGPERAYDELQRLAGIGPFYAGAGDRGTSIPERPQA